MGGMLQGKGRPRQIGDSRIELWGDRCGDVNLKVFFPLRNNTLKKNSMNSQKYFITMYMLKIWYVVHQIKIPTSTLTPALRFPLREEKPLVYG